MKMVEFNLIDSEGHLIFTTIEPYEKPEDDFKLFVAIPQRRIDLGSISIGIKEEQ
jgi:hypothetical protein